MKSLAKAIADLETNYAAAGVIVTSQQHLDDAYNWANRAEDSQYTDGDARTGYSAYHYSQKSSQSADAAEQWVLSVGLNEVDVITADIAVTAAHKGHILAVDASVGPITVTLPQIASVGEPFGVRVKKTDNSTNIVTVAASGTDTFRNGTISYLLNVAESGAYFNADEDTTPDVWETASFGSTSKLSRSEFFSRQQMDRLRFPVLMTTG